LPAAAESLPNTENHFRRLPKVSGRQKIVSGGCRKSPEDRKSFPAVAESLWNTENHFRRLPKVSGTQKSIFGGCRKSPEHRKSFSAVAESCRKVAKNEKNVYSGCSRIVTHVTQEKMKTIFRSWLHFQKFYLPFYMKGN
jgi:hypothetical protein